MRRSLPVFVSLLVVGLFGAWAGTSLGQVPPVPTVTVPTVTVPTVTVPPAPLPPPPPAPTVTTPTLPPPPKPPVEVPKPPVDPPPTPSVPLPVTVTSPTGTVSVPPGPAPAPGPSPSGTPSTTSGTAGGAAARHFGASSRIATVTRISTSKRWVSTNGNRRARAVWITFWLSRAGTVVFSVDQVAPDCRYVGQFLVRAHRGKNRVRFRGRLRGRALEPGTYRLTARPRRKPARRLTGVTVVVVERAPSSPSVVAAQARNVCPKGVPPSVAAIARDAESASTGEKKKKTAGVAGVQASSGPGDALPDDSPGLGAAFGTVSGAATSVPPLVFALGLLAILLLAVAAMPQPIADSRAGAALAHHRGTFALAGVAVLVAALLSFAISQ